MEGETVWRRTDRDLWVGSRDGRHVGIIERGRRFVTIDPDGEITGRFKTLDLAQAALEPSDGDV